MHQQNLSQAHVRESIAGEEDPGASLDVVRNLLQKQRLAHLQASTPTIHLDLTLGQHAIAADVAWRAHTAKTTAELLGLVVAHHGEIADQAWALFNRTGQRALELEVDEDRDGVFYISRRDG